MGKSICPCREFKEKMSKFQEIALNYLKTCCPQSAFRIMVFICGNLAKRDFFWDVRFSFLKPG
jgi:hypothetical protein